MPGQGVAGVEEQAGSQQCVLQSSTRMLHY
jgi:hypothetical protein